MAGTGTPALAAAVSNAGGLGSLGVGATNAEGAWPQLHSKLTWGCTDAVTVPCQPPAVVRG